MFSGRRHPNDDALVRRYMADRGLDALLPKDERVVRHVDICRPCAQRYLTVCEQLDAAGQLSGAVADEVFSPERLLNQRERILRRLDSPGARVLPFPAAEPDGRLGIPSKPGLKWIAAAAAAGLFVGLSTGRILNLGGGESPTAAPRSAMTSRPAPAIGADATRPATLAVGIADDAFLSEVDTALSAPRIPELEAIDALTLDVRVSLPPGTRD